MPSSAYLGKTDESAHSLGESRPGDFSGLAFARDDGRSSLLHGAGRHHRCFTPDYVDQHDARTRPIGDVNLAEGGSRTLGRQLLPGQCIILTAPGPATTRRGSSGFSIDSTRPRALCLPPPSWRDGVTDCRAAIMAKLVHPERDRRFHLRATACFSDVPPGASEPPCRFGAAITAIRRQTTGSLRNDPYASGACSPRVGWIADRSAQTPTFAAPGRGRSGYGREAKRTKKKENSPRQPRDFRRQPSKRAQETGSTGH